MKANILGNSDLPTDVREKILACVPESEIQEINGTTCLSARGVVALAEAVKRYVPSCTTNAKKLIEFALNVKDQLTVNWINKDGFIADGLTGEHILYVMRQGERSKMGIYRKLREALLVGWEDFELQWARLIASGAVEEISNGVWIPVGGAR